MTDVTMHAGTGRVNVTPHALAKMSNGLFDVSEKCPDQPNAGAPLLNYFLYCASIELGLKAAILSVDNSEAKKKLLRFKPNGHDLVNVHAQFQVDLPNRNVLGANDLGAIQKINPFFRDKGLEYVTLDVITELVTGMASFPELAEIRQAAAKVNEFLKSEEFFVSA